MCCEWLTNCLNVSSIELPVMSEIYTVLSSNSWSFLNARDSPLSDNWTSHSKEGQALLSKCQTKSTTVNSVTGLMECVCFCCYFCPFQAWVFILRLTTLDGTHPSIHPSIQQQKRKSNSKYLCWEFLMKWNNSTSFSQAEREFICLLSE